MIKTDTIITFHEREILIEGVAATIRKHNHFEIIFDSNSSIIQDYLRDKNYKIVATSSLPPDFHSHRVEYKLKTQEELDYENINKRISDLEKQFYIKITYTKL